MPEPRDTDIHTCHSECPCQTGGEPTPDFVSVEVPTLWADIKRAAYDAKVRQMEANDARD